VLAEVASAARRTAPRPAQRKHVVPAPEKSSKRWIIPVAAAAAVAAVAVFYGRDYLTRPPVAPAPVQTLRRDSAAASDSLPPTVVDSSPPLVIANPADSASASPFAVQIAMLDTEDGAAMRVNSGGNDFPVGTYAPVTRGADLGTWYRVVTGAYTDRTKADQLLSFLRTRGLVPQGWGTVIRAPLALQVGAAADTTQAAPMIADLQSRKVPVYALLQRDGTVRIYTGAFEAPEEAELFKDTLKNTKNIDATLVYRVGRAY
jgi:cell division septation protein DedD